MSVKRIYLMNNVGLGVNKISNNCKSLFLFFKIEMHRCIVNSAPNRNYQSRIGNRPLDLSSIDLVSCCRMHFKLLEFFYRLDRFTCNSHILSRKIFPLMKKNNFNLQLWKFSVCQKILFLEKTHEIN